MLKNEISVDDLKKILIAKIKSEDDKIEQCRQKILAKTGVDVLKKNQETEAKTTAIEIYSEFLAKILINQDDSLSKDFNDLYFKIAKSFFPEEVFNEFLKLKNSAITPIQDSYDDYWKWIELAVELAKENEMSTEDFIMSDNGYYKIVKLYYSKEEFIKYRSKSFEAFQGLGTPYNIEKLTDAVANRMPDGTRRQEIEKIVILEMMKLACVWEKTVKEEIKIIYG